MLNQRTIDDLSYQIALRVGHLEAIERQAAGPTPELLHHYTTAGGMIGIVQTGELWATNVLYLNDKTELTNAAEFFKRELDEHPLGLDDSVDFLRLLIHTQFGQSDVEHFVVSLCEGPDLLEQGRAYGGSGSGYALGFRSSALTAPVFGHSQAYGSSERLSTLNQPSEN